jgi:hypothetical protein
MGIALSMLSRWLRPSVPSQITRLADLGEDFERELILKRAPKVGLRVVDARLAAALELVDAFYNQSPQMDERRMA